MTITGTHYDYTHQAWTLNGRYVACEHPASMRCDCYGTKHAGKPAHLKDLPTAQAERQQAARWNESAS